MTSRKMPPISEWIVELRQFPEELLVGYRAILVLICSKDAATLTPYLNALDNLMQERKIPSKRDSHLRPN